MQHSIWPVNQCSPAGTRNVIMINPVPNPTRISCLPPHHRRAGRLGIFVSGSWPNTFTTCSGQSERATTSPFELDKVVLRTSRCPLRACEIGQSATRTVATEKCLADFAPRHTRMDRGHLEDTLRQFTDLWDALYPAERCRLVRSIVSRVIYDRPGGTLQIEFQGPGERNIQTGAPESPDLSPPTGSPNPRHSD